MDRATIVSPLLHAVLDFRDGIEWGTPKPLSGEVSVSEGESPACKGVVTRHTVHLPDVYASVCALMMNSDNSSMADVSEDKLTLLGVLDRTAGGLSQTRPAASFDEELTMKCQAQTKGEVTETAGYNRTVMDRVIRDCGGRDFDKPAAPTWFPRFDRATIPVTEEECGLHIHFRSPLPGVMDRDFAGRGQKIADMSQAGAMEREVVGCHAEELYVMPAASCHDIMPALKNCLRGALVYCAVISGPGAGKRGVVLDIFNCLHTDGNALLNAQALQGIHDEIHSAIELARSLQQALGDRPVNIHDQGGFAVALRLAQALKNNKTRTTADLSVGCGCTVQ